MRDLLLLICLRFLRDMLRGVRALIAAFRGVLKLAARNPDGLEHFDVSADGFWRSFFAAPVALPFFLVERHASATILAALDPDREPRPIDFELTVYFLSWPAVALAFLGLGLLLQRIHRFPAMVIAFNWLTVATTIVVCMAEIVVYIAPRVLSPFMLAVYAMVAIVEFRVVRVVMILDTLQSIGVVALTTLVSMLISPVVLQLW